MSKQQENTKFLFSTGDISHLAGGSMDFIKFFGINCAKINRDGDTDGSFFGQGEIKSGVCFPNSVGRISGQFNLKKTDADHFDVEGKGVFSMQCPGNSLLTADIEFEDIYVQQPSRKRSLMVASVKLSNVSYMPFKHPLLAELAMRGSAEAYFIFQPSIEGDLEDTEGSFEYAETVMA